ncbi:MAG: peptidoglycan-binding domain-containing protein [Roseobacter sp.]
MKLEVFRKTLPSLLVTTALFYAVPAFAEETTSDIAALRTEIVQVEQAIAEMQNPDSLLGLLKRSRSETLKITVSLLENQALAEAGAGTIEIVVPKVLPDPERAASLLEEITKQMTVVETAQADADNSGGLVQAVAMSRVEAEKLLLTQLKGAWMQATYGIALPGYTSVATSATPVASTTPVAESVEETGAPELAWADLNFPEIDYSKPIFASLHGEDYQISGWWGVSEYKAEVDDSPAMFGINVNGFTSGYGNNPSIKIGCREGTSSIIFDADDYLLTNHRSDYISVTYRLDEQKALTTNWNKITSSKGAGLFNQKAEAFMRKLYGSQKAFFRLSEKDGETHSLSLDMSGVDVVLDSAAAACGFSLLELTKDDYKAIQTMLNAGGYPAGNPDGQWGAGSKRAMKAFQAENGLPETGAPDRETLRAMGLES